MHLKMISQNVCPKCSSQINSESISQYHQSVQGTECRSFQCGLSLEYRPGINKIIETGRCTRDSKYRNDMDRLKAARQKIIEFFSTLDVDEKDLSNLIAWLDTDIKSEIKAKINNGK